MALAHTGRKHPSENPKLVARTVIEKQLKGEKIVMSKILIAHGYSPTTANNPRDVTETSSYKEEIENYAARLERHRLKILEAMEAKDLNEEQYRTLADAQTKVTHDVQLLTGGKTENTGGEDRMTLVAILAEIRGEALPPPKTYDGRSGKEITGSAEAI
jgi:hypothetical protein